VFSLGGVLRIPSYLLAILLSFGALTSAWAEPLPDTQQLLSERIQDFRAKGAIVEPALPPDALLEMASASRASRTYVSPAGRTYTVTVFTTPSDSQAYSIFTFHRTIHGEVALGEVGIASVFFPTRLTFVKGPSFVLIESTQKPGVEDFVGKQVFDKQEPHQAELLSLGRGIAAKLPAGDNDIPVLVKHLPWEGQFKNASYATSLGTLRAIVPNQPILDVVSFEGGAEAVSAEYHDGEQEHGKLLIIEFTTPQLATDNDQQITAKLNELKGINQVVGSANVPTAYRRVGNYAVFVFGGKDERLANQLIDQVKYEQVTQWLGDNPYPLLEAQRRYTTQTLGVLVSVVKASGLALVVCLTAGGLFGGLLFIRRRAQQKTSDAYSDAGGMLRLNLDEMTPQTDPARLPGK